MSGFLCLDGKIIPIDRASISPLDRGFLYGDGLFETIRAEKKRVFYLSEHLQRLGDAAEELRIPLPVLEWGAIAQELLERNGIEGSAKIKIIVSRGVDPRPGLPSKGNPTILVSSEPYALPTPEAYQRGWRLHVANGFHLSPLARFKSLNYLNCLMARQEALDNGADEAILLDRGKIAECSSGALLFFIEGSWRLPIAPSLPSLTAEKVISLLEERGQRVERRELSIPEAFSAETVWVLNSLLGIMPVRALGDLPLDGRSSEANSIREELFGF